MTTQMEVLERVAPAVALGFLESEAIALYRKWRAFRRNSERREIPNKISFKAYASLAKQAGITSASQIGVTPGCYQMGRYGDKGPYKKGNCRFITAEQNRLECSINGGYERTAAARRGLTKETASFLQDMSAKQAQSFVAISPKGRTIKGTNLTEFCRTKNLNKGRVCHLARIGDFASAHKGWRFKYT